MLDKVPIDAKMRFTPIPQPLYLIYQNLRRFCFKFSGVELISKLEWRSQSLHPITVEI